MICGSAEVDHEQQRMRIEQGSGICTRAQNLILGEEWVVVLTLPENRSLFCIIVSRRGFQPFLPPVESSPPGSQGELVTGVGWMSSHPSPCCQQHSKEQTGPGALISKDSPKLTRGVGIPPPCQTSPLFPHFDSTAGGKGWGLSQAPHSHSQFMQRSCHFAELVVTLQSS